MSTNRFIGATIEIACPSCGRKTAQTLSFVQSHENCLCPWCKKAIDLASPEISEAANEAVRSQRRRGTLSLFRKP